MKTRISNAAAKTILLASLAVASVSTPARAQYMVIEGASAPNTTHSQVVCCQTMYVQDYASFNGVNSAAGETENGLSSTQILNGMFDGYVGVFGAIIGIPAIITAVLRLFVRGQTVSKAKKKNFELPAAPAPARFYRPSAAGRY